ncbi:MAG: formyltransferase [Gammaproteobacteria bacterium]|nr:MAG: formyltransferase [Gammaproteobacteria bacterium]
MTRAVVFAYNEVGVRCLATLLAHGVEVPLVVTHEDDPDEEIFFSSVRRLAQLEEIECVTPQAAELPAMAQRIAELEPDFLFSFYYRYMIPPSLLALPKSGALNMHGSLLPRYRGRAPVNWAVLHGERETGASLHYMVEKPDAGDLVDQMPVPILPNDTAGQVFDKVVVAAELVLARSIEPLKAGTAPRRPLDLATGSYFGGRRPEDGRIDWRQDAWSVHNLIRAVAPPWPGAFTDLPGGRLRILGSHFRNEPARHDRPCLYVENDTIRADCADGRRLRLLQLEWQGRTLDAAAFRDCFGSHPIDMGDPG